MKKTVLALLILLFFISGCGAPKYCSDAFEPNSYRNHLAAQAYESYETLDSDDLPYKRKVPEIPIWEVARIDIELEYDKENDHVDITCLRVYNKDNSYRNLNPDTVDEVSIEWWLTPSKEVYVDDVIFMGSDGFYIFHLKKIIPTK